MEGRRKPDLGDLVLRSVVLDGRHSVVFIGLEALLDALDVVVFTAACLAPLQQTFQHDTLGRGVE